MKHIDGDKLLEYALETVSEVGERKEIERHLDDCPECRSQLKAIRDDLEFIGSLKPSLTEPKPEVSPRRKKYLYGIIRAAALIIFGFFIGLAVSGGSEPEDVYVTPCYVQLTPPADSLEGFAESDATGSSTHAYRKLMRSTN